jgi:hypothetical protein
MPKRQKTMSRTIAIAGLSVPIYENIEEPKKKNINGLAKVTRK